jgi:hypothetical protein
MTLRWLTGTAVDGDGEVTSVNGETGAVELSASDVGAAPAAHTHAISNITALQAALASLAPLASPTFTGNTGVSGGRTLLVAADETYSLGLQYGPAKGQYYIGATDSVSATALVFSNAGGTEKVRITEPGNVGIGTPDPQVTLDVAGTARVEGVQVFGANPGVVRHKSDAGADQKYWFESITADTWQHYTTDDAVAAPTIWHAVRRTGNNIAEMYWKTDNAETLRLKGGNVGIGTPGPTDRLAVAGAAGGNVLHVQTSSGNDAGIIVQPGKTSTTSNIQGSNRAKDGAADIALNADGGNVGVGTAPGAKLHARHDTAFAGIGGVHLENGTAGGLGACDTAYTVKSHYGTSQVMQWSDSGCRIGSRILANGGAGGLYLTYGADAVGIQVDGSGFILPKALVDAADDAAAATSGVPVGALYRNGSQVMVRAA